MNEEWFVQQDSAVCQCVSSEVFDQEGLLFLTREELLCVVRPTGLEPVTF